MRIRGVPLQDDFVFTVTIHITYRCIIRAIAISSSIGGCSPFGYLHRNTQIALWSIITQDKPSVFPMGFLAFINRPHFIGSPSFIRQLHIGSRCDRRLVHSLPITIDIETGRHIIFLQIAPTDAHAVAFSSTTDHHPSSQMLALHSFQVIARLSHHRMTQQEQQYKEVVFHGWWVFNNPCGSYQLSHPACQ